MPTEGTRPLGDFLTFASLSLVGELRQRKKLHERLAALQGAIVNRNALPEVLDQLAAGVGELLDGDAVAIRLVDPKVEGGPSRLVSSIGASQPLLGRWRDARRSELLSGLALAEGGRIVDCSPAETAEATAEFAAEGIVAAIIAPLYERGKIAGSLAVGSRSLQRSYSERDREVLLAFAGHAGLALNDARAAEETAHETFHDSLTGLPNRSLFIDRLEHALTRLARGGSPVAVLFCDLDGFKTVNDSLGHAAGDKLLAAVSSRLAEILRPADTVARLGGDEFAVLLEELQDPGGAARAAARVLDCLRSPFEVDGRELSVGASIGIAASVSAAESPDELLRNADLAMYRAKARGRGRYELFEPEMHAQIVRRMELEADLKTAIERDQLIVDYQPIVDLPSRQITGLEALVRWNHPTQGLLGPGQFIPIAEESGQIHAVGRYVLREACRQLALWRAKFPAYDWLYVTVNVSGIQLREMELASEVEAALGAAKLEPEHLMLEMTETVLMVDTASSAERLESLRKLGVRLAIDDFGTGYSSLEYLNRMPIDALKIAKPFVDDLGGGTDATAIPRAITDLAEIFGLTVVAEGIEREEQAGALADLGCRFGQGNLLGPPLGSDAAEAALFEAGLLHGEEMQSEPSERRSATEPSPTAEELSSLEPRQGPSSPRPT